MNKEQHDFNERWKKQRKLGAGGQGEVWLVEKQHNISEEDVKQCKSLFSAGDSLLRNRMPEHLHAKKVRETISEISGQQRQYGALKTLHAPGIGRDDRNAEKRLQNEIEAMRDIEHPALLRILDVAPDNRSYVSEYFPCGTLAAALRSYAGRPLKALRGVRAYPKTPLRGKSIFESGLRAIRIHEA